MAKQRTKTASPGSRGLENSSSESGYHINSAEIAALAYQLWQARGCPQGSPEVDWSDAEQQIRGRLNNEADHQVSEPILARPMGA